MSIDGVEPRSDNSWRAVGSRFPEALRRSFWYMVVGILFGAAFTLVADALHEVSNAGFWGDAAMATAFVFEHVGIGLFVSSTAVLFYEWGAHAKEALEHSKELRALLNSHGLEAIKKGMGEVFKSRTDLCAHHTKFIDELHNLNAPEGNWACDADVAFLTLFVKQAADHAERLHILREYLRWHPNDATHAQGFDFKWTSEFAPKILIAQMDVLGKGDRYDTLSNPKTWNALKSRTAGDDGQPASEEERIDENAGPEPPPGGKRRTVGFFEAGENAVERGVRIRRVFIIPSEEDDHYTHDDVLNLHKHFELAHRMSAAIENKNGYQIHFATTDVFKGLGVAETDRHYGIFRHGTSAVAFKVVGDDVANFQLVAAPSESALAIQFNQVWQRLAARRLDARQRADRFIDMVISREIRHLKAQGSRLEIVSRLPAWNTFWRDTPELKNLKRELAEIDVMQLFILEEGDKSEDVAKVVSARWQVRTIKPKDEKAEREPPVSHWRFVRKNGEPVHPYLFTTECDETLSRFFVEKGHLAIPRSLDFGVAFTEWWELAGKTP